MTISARPLHAAAVSVAYACRVEARMILVAVVVVAVVIAVIMTPIAI